MKISVEISMYPLNEDYKPAIIAFIKKLRTYDHLRLETSGMSTQIFGEYDEVMEALKNEVKGVFQDPAKVVMIMKWLNDDVSGPVKF
jgi:uncharacterized protein YqgV (UPF0045/DUF77 family)